MKIFKEGIKAIKINTSKDLLKLEEGIYEFQGKNGNCFKTMIIKNSPVIKVVVTTP